MTAPKPLLVTRHALAALFGVDKRTIANLAAEGMPKSARGRYDLAACVPWYLERERTAARGSHGLNDLDLARQRKVVAEARRAEIELAELEAHTIPMAVHLDRMRVRLEAIESSLRGLGRYQPAVKAAISDDTADALLDRMSDELRADLYALGDDAADAPAPVPADAAAVAAGVDAAGAA